MMFKKLSTSLLISLRKEERRNRFRVYKIKRCYEFYDATLVTRVYTIYTVYICI